jgi:enamine deaminase RidA (YjgF/YER057c/UK114 family)
LEAIAMGGIERISTNAPWEPIVGYSRAVKAGDWVSVSGTTATGDDGAIVGVGQMYVQARRAIANLASALGRLGLTLKEVVRTRMFVTDLNPLGDIMRAHREAFGAAPPASTLVEVRRLVHPDMLIEIEADAYAGGSSGKASARALSPKRKMQPRPRTRVAKKSPARKIKRRR